MAASGRLKTKGTFNIQHSTPNTQPALITDGCGAIKISVFIALAKDEQAVKFIFPPSP
jgi:hypothetical protein